MSAKQLPGQKSSRSKGERRQYSYDAHIPERREGEDRRGNSDRRSCHRQKK